MNTARVIAEHKTNYVIVDGSTEYIATVRGSFFTEKTFPKVGDFVLYSEVTEDKAVIEEIVPRTSTIVRTVIETNEEQVMVANVDRLFIVMGLDGDFNLNRLERYLLLAKQSNVPPVVVLNKCDIVPEQEVYRQQVAAVVGEAPVCVVSAITGENMESLLQYLEANTTAVLLGSSGSGKSTITNWLLREDRQEVQDVRAQDSRGRHTTTSRQLFSVPTGGFIIDTPGMRELSVQTTEDEEEAVFLVLDEISNQCRFANCDHEKSAGCALLQAVVEETISDRQLANYQKIKQERALIERRQLSDSPPDYRHRQNKYTFGEE